MNGITFKVHARKCRRHRNRVCARSCCNFGCRFGQIFNVKATSSIKQVVPGFTCSSYGWENTRAYSPVCVLAFCRSGKVNRCMVLKFSMLLQQPVCCLLNSFRCWGFGSVNGGEPSPVIRLRKPAICSRVVRLPLITVSPFSWSVSSGNHGPLAISSKAWHWLWTDNRILSAWLLRIRKPVCLPSRPADVLWYQTDHQRW